MAQKGTGLKSNRSAINKYGTVEQELDRAVPPAEPAAIYRASHGDLHEEAQQRIASLFKAGAKRGRTSLSLGSPLAEWMLFWKSAGLLDSVIEAIIHDGEAYSRTLGWIKAGHRNALMSDIPVLALMDWESRYRIKLNTHGLGKVARIPSDHSASINRCLTRGVEESLSDWINSWSEMGILPLLIAVLCDHGRSGNDATAHFSGIDFTSYKIDMLSFNRVKHTLSYRNSGELKISADGDFFFLYNITKAGAEQRLDAINWVTGNRVDLIRSTATGNTLSLMAFIINFHNATRLPCNYHAMGLVARRGEVVTTAPMIWDVLSEGEACNLLEACDLQDRAMAGVYPHTWISDLGGGDLFSAAAKLKPALSGSVLMRFTDSASVMWSQFIQSSGLRIGLPGNTGFRTVEYLDQPDMSLMVCDGRGFTSNEYRLLDQTHLSMFRVPIGSIGGYIAKSRRVNDDHSASSTSTSIIDNENPSSALTNFVCSLGQGISANLARPDVDLPVVLSWMLLDALSGNIQQISTRYQFCLDVDGFRFHLIPFVEAESAKSAVFGREMFGVDLGSTSDIRQAVLSDDFIRHVSPSFMTNADDMIDLRNRIAGALLYNARRFLESSNDGDPKAAVRKIQDVVAALSGHESESNKSSER